MHDGQMSYRRIIGLASRSLLASMLLVGVSLSPLASPWTPLALASTVVRACSYNQLDVVTASPSGAFVAAGNNGIPFYVVNISRSPCSLFGYPHISFSPQSFRGRTLHVSHGGGMIFVAVRPQIVVLKPGYTASFAIDFVDALNQQDPNGATCMTRTAVVQLPVLRTPFSSSYRPDVSFNFCFAGFRVNLTPIEAGPIPRLG